MIALRPSIGLALLLVGCATAAPASAPSVSPPDPISSSTPAPTDARAVIAPFDTDGDRIADVDDACPTENETYNGSDDEDGCPDCARFIVLTDAWELRPVRLDAHATIVSADDFAFDAAVFDAHTEMTRIGVESARLRGERDGTRASHRRAVVIEALVAHGIARERLVELTEAADARASASSEAAVTFRVLERTGAAYPLCNRPFPGCEASEATPPMILDRVYFTHRASAVSEQSRPVVEAIAALLVNDVSFERVEVRGFVGAREHAGVALARAETVRDALIARGVSASRLTAVSAGRAVRDGDPEAERVVRFAVVSSSRCRPPR